MARAPAAKSPVDSWVPPTGDPRPPPARARGRARGERRRGRVGGTLRLESPWNSSHTNLRQRSRWNRWVPVMGRDIGGTIAHDGFLRPIPQAIDRWNHVRPRHPLPRSRRHAAAGRREPRRAVRQAGRAPGLLLCRARRALAPRDRRGGGPGSASTIAGSSRRSRIAPARQTRRARRAARSSRSRSGRKRPRGAAADRRADRARGDNPFRIVVADGKLGFALSNGGEPARELAPGLRWLTNEHGLDPFEVPALAPLAAMRDAAEAQAALRAVLGDHTPHGNGHRFCKHGDGRGTVSSSIVGIPDAGPLATESVVRAGGAVRHRIPTIFQLDAAAPAGGRREGAPPRVEAAPLRRGARTIVGMPNGARGAGAVGNPRGGRRPDPQGCGADRARRRGLRRARGARERPARDRGIDGKRWLGIVESIEDRWGLAHAKDPAVGPDLSVIGGVGGGEIAFGWQSARSWRLALAAKSGEGAYRVVASGELGYAWLDWPAIRPGRREIAVWIVGDGGSRLAQFAERGGVLVDTGPSLLGFEKYWPFWSPDGDLLLTRAVRIRPGGGLDEALLAGDRVVLEGARVGFPTFGASGHEWACAVHRKGSFRWDLERARDRAVRRRRPAPRDRRGVRVRGAPRRGAPARAGRRRGRPPLIPTISRRSQRKG